MKLRTLLFGSAILVACAGGALAAELSNRGAFGEFFFDTATGLTWCDPDVLTDTDRTALDVFITRNSTGWAWATSAQIDALLGSTAPAGLDLVDVMGAPQFIVGAGGPRWIGYYAATIPDGWLIQSDTEPYDVLTQSGSQSGVEIWGPGGWFVNAADPTTMPRLTDQGAHRQLFHDGGSGLYWCDPALFVGLTRDQVTDWLTVNPGWRWATAAEVAALVGRLSAGDVSLVEILGAPQFQAGVGEPRWIGYYEQATQPDGLLLEANIDPYFHIMTSYGTQSFVASWNPGAWVVTEGAPTAAAEASWGEVKRIYR
ncbi:MAG: hypothetical protein Q7W29_01675 [bacterium]|nr:hypothetical protein [bacterium]